MLKGREYTFRTRSAPITVDELNEMIVPIVLNKHVYNAIGLTDEELTLDIVDWGTQVATPQTRAVGEKLEDLIAVGMAGADTRYEVDWEPDPDDEDDRSFYKTAVRARKHLNDENVPMNGRAILLGSNAEEAALNSKHLVDVDTSGTDNALREAIIGKIAGFLVVTSNAVDPDFAQAFHSSAYVFGNVAPEVPAGAGDGATVTFEGLAMRWIRDYDSDYLRDRSVYSSFAGVSSVEDGRNMDEEDDEFLELTGENVRAVKINYEAAS